jgi:hypothetical protein
MQPTRRNIVMSIGALLFGGGALVGSSALFASSAEADADMRVVTTGAALELFPGSAADADVITKNNGELTVDFTSANSGGTPQSAGVQPNATYQIGSINVSNSEIQAPLSADSVANVSEFPSVFPGTGTGTGDPGIVVQNNSSELVGVTVDYNPDSASDFPTDARVFVVMHDTGQAADTSDVHAKLFDGNGVVADSTTEEYRPVFSGEQLAISLWIYTGYNQNQGQNQTPNLSGELVFSGDDEGDVPIGSY